MKPAAVRDLVNDNLIDKPDVWVDGKLNTDLCRKLLEDDKMAPTLIAARVRKTIDCWKNDPKHVDISDKPDVLASLYSIGLYNPEKGATLNPEANNREKAIASTMSHFNELFGDSPSKMSGDPSPGPHVA